MKKLMSKIRKIKFGNIIAILVFLIPILIGSTLISCRSKVEYRVIKEYIIPDSLKAKQREWVTETIRAANQHLSAGDYEDIDDVVDEIYNKSSKLFEIEVNGLEKIVIPQSKPIERIWFIQEKDLNESQRKIYDSLLNIK